jgi:hypothetical protein
MDRLAQLISLPVFDGAVGKLPTYDRYK